PTSPDGVHAIKEGDRVAIRWLHTTFGRSPHCLGGWEPCVRSSGTPAIPSPARSPSMRWPTPNYVGHLPAHAPAVTGRRVALAEFESRRGASAVRRSRQLPSSRSHLAQSHPLRSEYIAAREVRSACA